jgi:hypothetical protein
MAILLYILSIHELYKTMVANEPKTCYLLKEGKAFNDEFSNNLGKAILILRIFPAQNSFCPRALYCTLAVVDFGSLQIKLPVAEHRLSQIYRRCYGANNSLVSSAHPLLYCRNKVASNFATRA